MIKIIYILIITLFFGCTTKPTRKDEFMRNSFKMYQYTLLTNTSDSLFLDIYILAPKRNFVFIKNSNLFRANIDISINITNKENDSQIQHTSWTKEVIEEFYKDTRSTKQYISIYKRFKLPMGIFRIYANIKDKDSNRTWSITDNKELNPFIGFSNVILKSKVNEKFIFNGGIIDEGVDSIFCNFQLNLPQPLDTSIISVIRVDNEEIIFNKTIFIDENRPNELYLVSLPVDINWKVNQKIKFKLANYEKEFILKYYHNSIESYWPKPSLALEIMAFYLDIGNFNEVKRKSNKEKLDFIAKYWKNRDPNPETEENELMVEFQARVTYSIENFSNISPGWRSDRGRIYINYGAPSFTEISQQNNRGYSYLVWFYPSGKQFVFVDEDGFGDFRLVKEVN